MLFLLPLFVLFSVVNKTHGQTTLNVVWMIPVHSQMYSNYMYNASSSVAALALGLKAINDAFILPKFTINITLLDTKCNSKESIGRIVDLLFQLHVDAVLGPPCSHVVQPVGELLAYRNIASLNWVSMGQTINYKNDLTTYIRTMAPISSLGGIMVLFYQYFGWRRMILISTEGVDYVAGAKTIETSLKYQAALNFTVAHHYSDVATNTSVAVIDQMLTNIIHEGRIIILVIPRDMLRTYMLRAHALGMTDGDYQFLFTDTKLADNEDVSIINSDKLWRYGDKDDDAAREAFENVLYFVLGHNAHPVEEWKQSAFDAYDIIFAGRSDIPKPVEPDEFSAYLHDTIILFAKTLNTSLSNGSSGRGLDLFTVTFLEFFRGLSGDVVMNKLGDRQPSFFVYDLNSSGIFHQVASLKYAIDVNNTKVTVNSSFTTIVWGNKRTTPYKPPDTPPCGFFDEYCPETVSNSSQDRVYISLSVGLTMLVVLLALFVFYRWWRGKKHLKTMSWKINPNDLNFNISKQVHSTLFSGRLGGGGNRTSKRDRCTTFPSGQTNLKSSRRSIAQGQLFTTIAVYKDEIVVVKRSIKKKINTDRAWLLEMKHLTEVKHTNLATFVGVCTAPEKICSVWEYCSKGSIQDVIQNDDIRLDTMFKMSLAVDICQGLEYIHKSPIKFHGNLKSTNCVIDSRWVCKLTDYGIQKLRASHETLAETIWEYAFYTSLFWTAPEILRKILKKQSFRGSHHGDIYALGIIFKELLCRNEPYSCEFNITPKEIIQKVAYPSVGSNVFRPEIINTELDSENRRMNMKYLIQRCWIEDPLERPSVKDVLRTLNKINPYKKASVVDNMIALMEKYTNNLEYIVSERTEQLREEKRKTDALLYRMLPRKVADDLKCGRTVQAEAFDSVTIYFSDVVEFTDLASESTPLEIVELLNSLYTMFDDIINHYDVYKVETIGDAYMIVSGLPERNGNLHVKEIALVALDILKNVLSFRMPHKPERQLEIRIGLNTGSVVAGVVGLTMPRYCLFGDTVNTASRMETLGLPLKIHISSFTMTALQEFPEFEVEERGELFIKGKGKMRTYWLCGRHSSKHAICFELSESFTQLIEPDSPKPDDKLREANIFSNIASGIFLDPELINTTKGKISVADSGISVDRSTEDRIENVLCCSDNSFYDDVTDGQEKSVTHKKMLDDSDAEQDISETIIDNDVQHDKLEIIIHSQSYDFYDDSIETSNYRL